LRKDRFADLADRSWSISRIRGKEVLITRY
jgi:hypothetical protein